MRGELCRRDSGTPCVNRHEGRSASFWTSADRISLMPYVRVGGIDLYYEAHGTGPRVVILAHGALGSIDFAEASGRSVAPSMGLLSCIACSASP